MRLLWVVQSNPDTPRDAERVLEAGHTLGLTAVQCAGSGDIPPDVASAGPLMCLRSIDTRNIIAYICSMRSYRTAMVTAINLARRKGGVSASELVEVLGCPLRTAQRRLAVLAQDGLLLAEVPERKGKRRGDWRTVYRAVKETR